MPISVLFFSPQIKFMKYFLRKAFCIALLLLTPTAQAAKIIYTLDTPQAAARWYISVFSFSNKWHVDAKLAFDQIHPQNSKINITIPTTDIVTRIKAIDSFLRSKDFFNTTQYPNLTFISNKIKVLSKNKAEIFGTLTLHGISKPETLNAIINSIDINPITKKQTVSFTANITIKLSDFDLKVYLPGLGDEVKIKITAKATGE